MLKKTKKIKISPITSTNDMIEVKEKKLIGKLTGIGGNEDFNKVVEKINELIEHYNGCTI